MQENTTPLSQETKAEMEILLLNYMLSPTSKDEETKPLKQAEENARAKGEPSL